MGTLLIVDIILCAAIENSYRNRLVSHFIVGSAGHPSKIANYCDSTKFEILLSVWRQKSSVLSAKVQ